MAIKSAINLKKSREKIQKLSLLVEKRLAEFDQKEKNQINSLSFEELQDFQQILKISDYILYKYEGKKAVFSLLKEFVDMISNSVNSMDLINDEISELVVSAEYYIKKIKALKENVSENFTLDSTKNCDFEHAEPKCSTNNLTKSTTPVYI